MLLVVKSCQIIQSQGGGGGGGGWRGGKTNYLFPRKVFNCHILETRLPMDEVFAQLCSIVSNHGHICQSLMTRIEKTIKLKSLW